MKNISSQVVSYQNQQQRILKIFYIFLKESLLILVNCFAFTMQQTQLSKNILQHQENISTNKNQQNISAKKNSVDLQAKQHSVNSVKQALRINKITRFGPWNGQQIEKYYKFLLKIQTTNKAYYQRQQTIFTDLSKYIRTRNVPQCKLYHRKLIRKFRNRFNIMKYYKSIFKSIKLSKRQTQYKKHSKKQKILYNQANLRQLYNFQSQDFFKLLSKDQTQRQFYDQPHNDDTLIPTNYSYELYPHIEKPQHSKHFLKLLNNQNVPIRYYGASNPYLIPLQENPFIKLLQKPMILQSFEKFSEAYQHILKKNQVVHQFTGL